jgi:hypothetical protein
MHALSPGGEEREMKDNADSNVTVIAAIMLTINLMWLCPAGWAEPQTVLNNDIHDDDPGMGFSNDYMWVSEQQGWVELVVLRGSDWPGAFTVDYATTDGTARAGSDYVAASGKLEFGEDEVSKRFEIELINDAVHEPEETFVVRLSNPSAEHVLDPQRSVATVRIEDNDRGVGFSPTGYLLREDRGSVQLRVERQTDDPSPFQVSYSTHATGQDGWSTIASADIDYVHTSGVLEFAEWENVKTIEVEIVNDGLWEPEEEFQVVLSNVTGLEGLFESTATVVIQDNDTGIHFDRLQVHVSERESSVTLTVHRGADSVEAFTVDYTTVDVEISGVRGYRPVSGTLEFEAGVMTQGLMFGLSGPDGVWEGDDELKVVLSRPTGVGFLDPDRNEGRVVIVDNEPLVWEAHRVGESFPEVADLRAVTWGGGRYVAVGGEWALTSVDARKWTAQRVEGLEAWDVTLADGQYVAVGDNGIWRSVDGLRWTKVAAGPRHALFRVSHGDGLHVVLDRNGRAWMTPDLEGWRWVHLGADLRDLAHGEAGFVVVANDGNAWHGTTEGVWEALGRIAPIGLGAVAWGEQGYLTATSEYDHAAQSEQVVVFHSVNGRDWETNRLDVAVWTPSCLVYGDGAYVGRDTWSRGLRLRWESDRWVTEDASGYWYLGDMAYGNAGYVSTGISTVSVSEDGLRWERLHHLNLTFVHSAGGTLFVEHVFRGFHWSYYELYSSTDASTWTLERSGPGVGSRLVSLNGVVGDLRDGVLHLRNAERTWNIVHFQGEGWKQGVAAGSGWWLVVSEYWDPVTERHRPVAYRSENGEGWESHFMGYYGAVWQVQHAGEWFYALGHEDNVGEVIMQSRDGAAWQRSGLSGQYGLYAVAYGKGSYVAAAHRRGQDRPVLLRSVDGVTWEETRILDLGSGMWADADYGSGLFVVTWRTRNDGPDEQELSYLSLDGLEWRRHTPLLDGSMAAMAHADGRFVAVGERGLVLRSQPIVYLGEPRLDVSGEITARFEGEAGREYVVEGSTDLVHWRTIGTIAPSQSVQEIVLPVDGAGAGRLFYRLGGAE